MNSRLWGSLMLQAHLRRSLLNRPRRGWSTRCYPLWTIWPWICLGLCLVMQKLHKFCHLENGCSMESGTRLLITLRNGPWRLTLRLGAIIAVAGCSHLCWWLARRGCWGCSRARLRLTRWMLRFCIFLCFASYSCLPFICLG